MELKVLLVVCGTWSLDFCSVIPPFCVSSSIKTVHVHVLVLEYLVVFYPLCLILITYILYKLHDNNSNWLCGYGNHFTDIMHTSGGDGIPNHQCFYSVSGSRSLFTKLVYTFIILAL